MPLEALAQNLKICPKASRQRYALPQPERIKVKPRSLIGNSHSFKARAYFSWLVHGIQRSNLRARFLDLADKPRDVEKSLLIPNGSK